MWEPPPERIAIFRALQLGDMLCAVPALRALRAHVPRARITLIGLPWAAAFVERFADYVDDFIPFPGAAGFPEQTPDPGALPLFFASARARRFDVAIQLHGSGECSNPVVLALGARRCAGFVRESAVPPPGFLRWPDGEPEIRRYLRLMAHLGVPLKGSALEFPLAGTDWEEYGALADAHGLKPGRYMCVHPGARLLTRRWPPDRFAAVADELADAARIVITGSADERELAGRVERAMRRPALNLAGKTRLGSLAALIAGSRMLLCNDTGVSHVAAALGTSSVVISSGTDVRRWAPLDAQRHRFIYHMVPCRPCGHYECPIGHPCALGVPVERVALESRALLQEEPVHAA
jgi:ADP-heptose:LPS heptosyltransferase